MLDTPGSLCKTQELIMLFPLIINTARQDTLTVMARVSTTHGYPKLHGLQASMTSNISTPPPVTKPTTTLNTLVSTCKTQELIMLFPLIINTARRRPLTLTA
jgi:hypothetical protein